VLSLSSHTSRRRRHRRVECFASRKMMTSLPVAVCSATKFRVWLSGGRHKPRHFTSNLLPSLFLLLHVSSWSCQLLVPAGRSAASMPIVRLPDARKYHMSASHGITCHSETLMLDTIPPCLLAADVALANRNTEVDHPAKPSCHDEATFMQDQLSQADYYVCTCMHF
jgi:hypothetical protein